MRGMGFKLDDDEKVVQEIQKVAHENVERLDKDDRLNQATQASRISTTMSMRILGRLIQEEDKVVLLKFFRLRKN